MIIADVRKASLIPSLYLHPLIDTVFVGPEWSKLLASSLVSSSCGTTGTAEAMRLCHSLISGEFDLSETSRWEDLPSDLRVWLQTQDGLKLDGNPIASVTNLLEAHGMLLKKPAIAEETLKSSIAQIFIEVVSEYYRLVGFAAQESTLDHLMIRGTKPMPLKCSRCKSRLLDDAFPRFKKNDKERYVVHRMKRGCGSVTCQNSQGHGFAVPWNDRVPWAAPKTIVLERPPRKADWTDVFLRQDSTTLGSPSIIQIICRACNDKSSIQEDKEPRWTIETPPRYVIRKPLCKVCCRTGTTWRTVDPGITWVDVARMSVLWKKKEKKNWDVDDMIKHPNKYFPKTQDERRAARRKRTKRIIRYHD